jgi:hypothetical protein
VISIRRALEYAIPAVLIAAPVVIALWRWL